jgi:hypothetical protein
MEVSEFAKTFAMLERCCLHNPQWHPGQVVRIIDAICDDDGGWHVMDNGGKSFSDSSSVYLVELEDGFGLLEESEDYTGHGCQCDSFTGKYGTLEEALQAIPEGPKRDLMRTLT